MLIGKTIGSEGVSRLNDHPRMDFSMAALAKTDDVGASIVATTLKRNDVMPMLCDCVAGQAK